MSLGKLVLKNIKMNLKNYGMYLFSIVFSVFTIYTFFALGNSDDFLGNLANNAYFESLFQSFAWVILFVLFFYLKYINKQFVKSRKKEIALYSLFGVSNTKIGAMLFIENLMIGLFGLGIGLVFGIIFFKLIGTLFVNILGGSAFITTVPFAVNWKGLQITSVVFLIYFIIIGLFSLVTVNRSKLIDLFQAENVGEKQVKGSWFLLILSIVLIASGYYIACNDNPVVLFAAVLLILLLVIVGTYLFFTSGIQVILNILRKSKKYILKGDRLLVISTFKHRIRSNAFMISAITVLSAIAITLVACAYGIYYSSNENAKVESFYDISYQMVEGTEDYHQEIKNILEKNNRSILSDQVQNFAQLDVCNYQGSENYCTQNTMYLITDEDYNDLVAHSLIQRDPLHVEENELYIWQSGAVITTNLPIESITLEDKSTYLAKPLGKDNPLPNVFRYNTSVLIADEATYQKIVANNKIRSVQKIEFINYEDSKNSETILSEVQAKNLSISMYYEYYLSAMIAFGTMLFIASFMALVFMIATASLLYFKILSTMEEDRDYYRLLDNIGTTEKKKRKIITKQILPVFLCPLMLAMLHATFAIKSASTVFGLWGLSLWKPSLMMFGIYTFIYLIFAYITIRSYQKRVLKGTN